MSDPVFNFLVPAESDGHLAELKQKRVDEDWMCFVDGVHAWSLQTYLILKECGVPVKCSRELDPAAINVGHVVYLNSLVPRRDAFLVSIQADYPRHGWAHLHIVQNRSQLRGPSTFWLPHWPQPGLVGRDPKRNKVECVAYMGRPDLLAGSAGQWRDDLDEMGLRFEMLGVDAWDDLSNVDILVAIRSFDRKTYRTKPPTKLFNAWLAGIPLVAGADSAYVQVGMPGEDYLSVSTREQALEVIERLRDDPEWYTEITAAGRKRCAVYARDGIAEMWKTLLTSTVAERYAQWRERGGTGRVAFCCRVLRGRVVSAARRTARKVLGG